ncbi:hypothetical protein [Nioella aestuarii]|uniref:hypothetical protein n=1 Tax=Nioella aestuarii TaxID=1662864 RepID=UPI003D7FD7C3
MRVLLLLALLASTAHARQPGYEGRICTLTHSGDNADIGLTGAAPEVQAFRACTTSPSA